MLTSYTLQQELKKYKLPNDAIADQLLTANHEFFLYKLQQTKGKKDLVDEIVNDLYSPSKKLGGIQHFYHSFEKALNDDSVERIIVPVIDSSIVTLTKKNPPKDDFARLFSIDHKNNTYEIKLNDPNSARYVGHYGVMIYYKISNEFHYFDAMNDETFYLKYCIMIRLLLMFSCLSTSVLNIRAPLFKYKKLQKLNDHFSCGHFVISFVLEYKGCSDKSVLKKIENKRNYLVDVLSKGP